MFGIGSQELMVILLIIFLSLVQSACRSWGVAWARPFGALKKAWKGEPIN
jgi:Sec-independent protein translocase protein TatA